MLKQEINVFVISLKHRQDRRSFMTSQLNKLEIEFKFFDAISPDTIPWHINRKFSDNFRRWFRSRPLSSGERGCYASHYSLWCKCLAENKPMIILEDDSYIEPDFVNFLSLNAFDHFDYVCLEKHPHSSDLKGNFCLRAIGKGARGYFINPYAASRFIESSRMINRAVDNLIGDLYLHKVPPVGLVKPIVIDQEGELLTDIQFGEKTKVPIYMKATRELYRFYRFIMNWAYFKFFSSKAHF